jgi:hypothetical protein
LIDCDCNPLAAFANVTTFTQTFGTYWTEKTGHKQQISIDTALLPPSLCCFSVRLQAVDSTGAVIYEQTSEPYLQAGGSCLPCDRPTTLIEAEYKKTDCDGRVYNQAIGGETFKIKFRVYGSIEEFTGFSTTRTENDRGDVLSREITTRYRFRGGLVPPYFLRMVSTALFADSVYIGGVKIDSIEAIDRNNEDSRMAHLDFEFSSTCELSNFECD